MNRRHRLVVDASHDAYMELQKVMHLGGIASVGDFMKQAMRFYRAYILLRSTGQHVYIKKDNNTLVAWTIEELEQVCNEQSIWTPQDRVRTSNSTWRRIVDFLGSVFGRKSGNTLN